MDIKPSLWSFDDFFSTRPRLIIPRFQREYSWEEKNYKQYLDDMYHCLQIENDELMVSDYFLGNMLFVPQDANNKDSILDVIDGQQRLTTITILLSALAKTFNDIGMNKQASRIFDNYILPSNDDDDPQRIIRTKTSDPYFADLIQQKNIALGKVPIGKKCQPNNEEEETINNTYQFFLKAFEERRVRSDLSNQLNSDNLNKIDYSDILKAIRKQVLNTQFISIVVNSQSEGYRLFESLNSKGKPLSNVDMVKNALFELLNEKEPSDFASNMWNELHNNLAGTQVSLADFYYLFWHSRYNNTSENKLYDAFKKEIKKNTKDYKEFLESLVKASSLLKQVVNPDLKYFKNKKAYIPFVNSLKRIDTELGIRQARIVSIALFDAYERTILKCKDLERVGIILEDFLFAYTSVTSGRANRYAGKFSSFARELHKITDRGRALKLIDKLRANLTEKYPDRDQFIAGYKKLIYSSKRTTKSSENMKAKYALRRLSDFYTSGYALVEPTVEHIMPDNGTSPSILIGNLLMIEGSLNEKADTSDFKEKIKIFKDSKSDFVKNFIGTYQDCSSWNDQTIANRTEQMAEITYDQVLTSFIKNRSSH